MRLGGYGERRASRPDLAARSPSQCQVSQSRAATRLVSSGPGRRGGSDDAGLESRSHRVRRAGGTTGPHLIRRGHCEGIGITMS